MWLFAASTGDRRSRSSKYRLLRYGLIVAISEQRQLLAELASQLAFDEVPQTLRYLAALGSYMRLQRASNVLGGIPRPALYRIEGHDPLHLVVLAGQQVIYQGDVSNAFVGLAEYGAGSKIFQNKIKVF